ncbi:D-hexose-6-phosphate mutarotase [Occallatibacter savannae]|uniref:D-hexose-6-phosphate mutarotase n=1 Tax=Occallatibacter savannae TaxID=1002691 RepID=UPI0013A5ADE6|nr:D-hexose-6-phosphate mutarotase [Occallatibacter savannae]
MDARLAEMNDEHGVYGAARVEAGNGGLPKISIETKLGKAEVYVYGAQVTSWKPAGFDEVIFVSAKSHWERGKAIRGGIPVCFPWFRAKPDDANAPMHGFVRTKEWKVESTSHQADDSVSLLLSTESDAESRRWWPHEFRLEYSIKVGKRLELELKMENRASEELRFQEALHTYFKVGDVEKCRVVGLDGVHYLDNRDNNKEKVQRGDLVLSKFTDNAYLDATGTVAIVDSSAGRRLVTEKSGSVSTIVWNPWSDGAAKLADFGADEWRGMLCVEGGNVLGQAVVLPRGGEHRMRSVLSCTSV